MRGSQRIIVALAIFLSGFALLPFTGWTAEAFEWQQFTSAYRDIVNITRAEFDPDDRELEVRATSTNPNATLRVYETRSRRLIGTMSNEGGGDFRLRTTVSRNPQNVTVVSSSGGRDSAPVQLD